MQTLSSIKESGLRPAASIALSSRLRNREVISVSAIKSMIPLPDIGMKSNPLVETLTPVSCKDCI